MYNLGENMKSLTLFVALAISTGTLFAQDGKDQTVKVVEQINEELTSFAGCWPHQEVKKNCGETGTLEERIKDCSAQPKSKSGNFVLVVRTTAGKEVWKDTKNKQLWSDRQGVLKHSSAQIICDHGGNANIAGLKFKWRLPDAYDYEDAAKNGLMYSFPFVEGSNLFWSSRVENNSMIGEKSAFAYVFNNETGAFHKIARYNRNNVRCVADLSIHETREVGKVPAY
jgi:hypothetical protein